MSTTIRFQSIREREAGAQKSPCPNVALIMAGQEAAEVGIDQAIYNFDDRFYGYVFDRNFCAMTWLQPGSIADCSSLISPGEYFST